MNEDIRFGRIAGISVGASWSLIVIVGLITWTVAEGVLPGGDADYPVAVYWAVGAAVAVAFLASLLAHELAHALVARSRGMPVEGITLWMFGGVSRLGGDAPDARTELRMAAVGPLTSVGIGVGFGAVAVALAAADAPGIAVDALAWLGFINVALAVFNMLPAFPLDGGRVLRAGLWMRTGDVLQATRTASGAGVAFGYGLMALGVVSFLAGVAVSGLWLLFLGWIVLEAARSELASLEIRLRLGDLRVADVMTPDPVTVPAGVTVDALVHDYVARHRCSAFPVVGAGGVPTGLATLSGIREVPEAARGTMLVDDLARPMDRVVTARPDDRVVDLIRRFAPGRGGRALVLDDAGAVAGIVTASDVERALTVTEAQPPGAGAGPRSRSARGAA
jgi:Zn-dependent protease